MSLRRGISKAIYEQALATAAVSPLMQNIVMEMEEFIFDCDIMLCGINDFYKPYIISARAPGIVIDCTRQGFNSIGIGADIANPRMLWSKYERTHPVGRVLFDVFDAKANAEMSPGVGFSWDAIIIFADDGYAYEVPKTIKQLIESSWDEHNRSPFEEWNPEEDLPRPEERWKERILAISKDDLSRVRRVRKRLQSTKDDPSHQPPSQV